MNKMCMAHLGLLLLALHLLSSQVVQAGNGTASPMSTTMSNTMMSNGTDSLNPTSTDKNGSGRMEAFTLLLPLAVAAALLHGWS